MTFFDIVAILGRRGAARQLSAAHGTAFSEAVIRRCNDGAVRVNERVLDACEALTRAWHMNLSMLDMEFDRAATLVEWDARRQKFLAGVK